MPAVDDVVETLSGLTLFADLNRTQLEALTHDFAEESVGAGDRIIRQGFTGTDFCIIIDGKAEVRIDGDTVATLGRGDYFGEISVLLGEPPTADVVALTPLRYLALPGPELGAFLMNNPRVMYRILQAEARTLRNTLKWLS
jgi:CRP-like cAMP-binding protein